MQTTDPTTLVLHGNSGSPFVSRVRMQGYAKGIPLELRPTGPVTPEFLRMNPLGKVPVLEHAGLAIPESSVISEYLEELFPTPSLLGTTPQARMRVRLVVRALDLYCGGVTELLWAAADPGHKIDTTATHASLNKGLGALESFLVGETYAASNELSLADCALVPWLFYGNMLTQNGDDTLTRQPRLSRYNAFIGEQELARRVWGEMDESFRAFIARWKAQQAAGAPAKGAEGA
jgi:glutathione S-transferase